MKLCKVEKLTEGDILARAVFAMDFRILLSEETSLSADYIEKLKSLGISEVYIHDENYKNIEAVVILKQEVEELFKVKVKDILEKHTYSKNKELQKLSQTADNIIFNILEEKKVVEKIYDIKERSSDLYEHSISICTLATLVALKMKLPKETVHDIGVACLLHDLGLRYMTFDYTLRNMAEFLPVELMEYRKHPVYGYSTLKEEAWISSVSKDIILYHHERKDGSGFPLKKKDIPLEAMIVGVCDCFDEMICGICCQRVKVHEAVEYLKVFKGIRFDEKVVDILLQFTAVYPVGSHVLTNVGETGIVIRQNSEFPDRPVIRIIKDKMGNNLVKHKEVNLINSKTVFIEKVLE